MRFIQKIIFLSFLFLLILAGGFYIWATQAISNANDSAPQSSIKEKQEFSIKQGSNVRSAAKQLKQAGVPIEPLLFGLLARITGKSNKLKAGTFEWFNSDSPIVILNKIVNGEFSNANLVIIEGWTFRQMRNVVDNNPSITHETTGISDSELLKKISKDFSLSEGLFFPDTYVFAKGSSDIQIYQLAHDALLKHLEEAWAGRAEGLPYKNSYEALIMASIIEKETGHAAERNMIASVFVNRLKIGMLLQTDPTVIYGMGAKYDGNIRKRDLTTDTPYNTYTRAGLPPSPIALPGQASIIAALHPAPSKALYFVAKGDGTSYFSTSLEEHNRAVNKYQR